MSVAGIVPQHIQDSPAEPFGAVRGKSQLPGDLIRLLKGDADVPGTEDIGVLFDLTGGIGAPLFPHPDGHCRIDPVPGEKQHHGPDAKDPGIFLGDLRRLLWGDAPDFRQALGFLFHDGEGIVPEGIHNPARQSRADPPDRPAGKIFEDRPGGSRDGALDHRRLELGAIGGMAHIPSGQAQFLTGLDAHGFPHHGDQRLSGCHLHDGEAGILIVKDNVLYRSFQNLCLLSVHSFRSK